MINLIKCTLAIIIFSYLIGCGGNGFENKPTGFNGLIWAGNSKEAAIERTQDNQKIQASDPAFDNYMAMSYDDFQCFAKVFVLNCMQYKQQHVDCSKDKLSKGTIQRTIIKYENKFLNR